MGDDTDCANLFLYENEVLKLKKIRPICTQYTKVFNTYVHSCTYFYPPRFPFHPDL